jgi:hypothetical protein
VRIKKLTIIPDGDSIGSLHHAKIVRGRQPEFSDSTRTHRQFENAIMVSIAGPIAQRRYSTRSYRGWQAASDHRKAVDLATARGGSIRQAEAYLKYLGVCVEDMLFPGHRWRSVEALACELMRRRTMGGKEVFAFLVASTDPRHASK